MADPITPTQPLTPSPPVTAPPDDKRKDKQKPPHIDNEQDETDNDDTTERPHKGLFDEYV